MDELRGLSFSEVIRSIAAMTGTFKVSTSGIRRARSSRVLSFLLLFLISYGSSTEIFHHHGLAAQKSSVAENTNATSNSFSSAEQKNSSSRTQQERDCLVCQFQRGLSSAAIFAPLLILAPIDIQPGVSSNPITRDSLSTTASRGRAPPITL
jgi:hypothetical protein